MIQLRLSYGNRKDGPNFYGSNASPFCLTSNAWCLEFTVFRSSFSFYSFSLIAHSAPGAFATDLSHIRLFPNVPSQSEDDDDGTNEWFCRTCKIQLDTQRAFTLHLRGVTHIQKALGEVQQRQQEQQQRFAGWPGYRSALVGTYIVIFSLSLGRCFL